MMEEVSDDTNGESSFEFVASSNFTPVTVTDVTQTTPITDKGIGDYFKDSANISPPSALPVFDIDPNLSSNSALSSSFNMPPAVPPMSTSQTSNTIPNVVRPVALPPQPPAQPTVSTTLSTQPKVVQSTPTMTSIPPPPSNTSLPLAPPPINQISHFRPSSTMLTPPPPNNVSQPLSLNTILPPSPPTPAVQATSSHTESSQQIKKNNEVSPPPPGMFYRPNQALVPPCVPSATTFQPSAASTSLDFSGDYVASTGYSSPYGQTEDESGNGLFGWIKDSVKGNEFLHKFAEKAKNSVDSVIYTLDPQMKAYMNSSPESVVNIVVASEKEVKISAIREAFQSVFIQANVHGVASQANIAEQPVGFTAAIKGTEERIMNIRQHGSLHPNQIIIAIENFILEPTPDNWYDIGCLKLQDPHNNISLQVFTQSTPISSQFITQLQNRTPSDYPLRWSGFAVPIGQIIGSGLGVPHTEWHQAVCGVSRKEILVSAAKSLAGLYKARVHVLPTPYALSM